MKIGRAWQYFKCNNCGKDALLAAGNNGSYVCECKQTGQTLIWRRKLFYIHMY